MNRAGIYVDNLTGEATYQSFKPNPLPPMPEIKMDEELVKLLIDANKQLVKLDTASQLITNADLFVSMYVRKEALISSQIEGTQCTLDDVLDPEVESNANLDVSDVINYVKATQYALKRLERLPLCCRLIREIHEILMENVRGQDKTPGEFRHSQNWIGPANCSLKDARYIPPNVEDMQDAMSDLEKYINENTDYDPLIRVALIHYQFETIHPFLDGNGRIGRLLILLYLMEQGLLAKPVIYISYFLKKNQIEYYDRISEVRRIGNFEQWIRFFLEAVSKAASDSLEAIRQLSELHDKNIKKLPKTTRSKDNLRAVFDYIVQYPIIDIKRTAKELEISYNTAATAVKKLVELGILQETTNAARNRVFAYEEYLGILRKDT
ncbi:MAG: Fic family protein [Lachnospiraceae bacterium]|nr:Fic family protein [Lachnospiraceae bacterium]